MKVLVIGSEQQQGSIKKMLSGTVEVAGFEEYPQEFDIYEKSQVVFDFHFGIYQDPMDIYSDLPQLPIFVDSSLTMLLDKKMMLPELTNTLFGFNALPYFSDTPPLEVALVHDRDKPMLLKISESIGLPIEIVDDRVGMVRPRIISMIINEAFYTVMEKTASKEDIDLGMKLGTNYPKGPFEFLELIGIQNVYDILEAIYEDTKDERYKICPLLKKEYLRAIAG
jgi:3-hydroxybutyryl-CoA dehydrogenase